MQNSASAISVAVLVGTLVYAGTGDEKAFALGVFFVFSLYACAYIIAKLNHDLAASTREMDEVWRTYLRHATAVERHRPIQEAVGLVGKRG